jgi:hypothetical protein
MVLTLEKNNTFFIIVDRNFFYGKRYKRIYQRYGEEKHGKSKCYNTVYTR